MCFKCTALFETMNSVSIRMAMLFMLTPEQTLDKVETKKPVLRAYKFEKLKAHEYTIQ